MKFKVDEISSVITEEIQKYRSEIDVAEVGIVGDPVGVERPPRDR